MAVSDVLRAAEPHLTVFENLGGPSKSSHLRKWFIQTIVLQSRQPSGWPRGVPSFYCAGETKGEVLLQTTLGRALFIAILTFTVYGSAASIKSKATRVSVVSTANMTTATFSPMSLTASILPNPDRGGLSNTGYNDMISKWDSAAVTAGIAAGKRLGYCMFNLNAFINSAITQTWLDTFQSRMNSMRTAGMGCVMMFYYDNYSGSGVDASASRISSHLQQLKPYFDANTDVIKYFKGGFVGAWGEWHSSQSCNASIGSAPSGCTAATAAANQAIIRDALLANVPKSIAVQFRQPPRVAEWFGSTPITAGEAYSGTNKSRAGLSNDCMLSGTPGDSTGDTGTWWQWTGNLSATALRTYADGQTQYTPYGGELANNCAAPQRTTCEQARADFSRWHLTWLKNSGGDNNFRDGWAAGGCTNEIENLQGYRIQLDSLSIPSTATTGTSVAALLNLRNVGWSRSHYPRLIEIVFDNGVSTSSCKSQQSLRDLPPQASASTTFNISCAIPTGIAKGTWSTYIRIPDIFPTTANMANFATRPANSNSGSQVWDAAKFRFATGLSVIVN